MYDAQALNGALTNTVAFGSSLSRAHTNLEVAIDSGVLAKVDGAECAFRIFLKAYECAIAEHRSTYAKYMIDYDTYISRVEAAAERVERLFGHEAERAATVTTARTVGASTHLTLLEGLPPIYVVPNAQPLIHSDMVQEVPDADAICDPDIACSIQDFQAQTLYKHSELHNMKIQLRPAVQEKAEYCQRYLDQEEDFANFFEPEILKPKPYGLAKEPEPRSRVDGAYSSESECDYQMRMANLPTADYGRLAIGQQLRAYVRVRDIAAQAPPNVAGCLNRKYGILTDFNQTWVVKFEQLSVNRDNRNFDDRSENLEINVSERFAVRNAIPHMAFVYAYVVSEVVKDIRANPDKYPQLADIHCFGPGPGRVQ
ncbi:hypothetical protein GGH96_006149 [Coemansia sp. RSA 1972]|nr:hypothetical protein GGH96_006149 [Coemansia sp. RSA 1972]